MNKHILVLFHAHATIFSIRSSVVFRFARYWRERGYRVTFQFGTDKFVPSDLIFLHVDLSVVPNEYIEYAKQYPVAVNGQVKDIRKSKISENLVQKNDVWQGPVIAKSDLNFAGKPEYLMLYRNPKRQNFLSRHVFYLWNGLGKRTDNAPFKSWRDYQIFDHFDDVPDYLLNSSEVVLERFLPDKKDGFYHIYMFQFLGDRVTCRRVISTNPLVKADTSSQYTYVDWHPAAEKWRDKFNLDYGKIDYVIHNGNPVLLDVNKTVGAHTAFASGSEGWKIPKERSMGIDFYFR